MNDTNQGSKLHPSSLIPHPFPTGASYYPPHHDPSDWARDVAAMAEAGMTCIRSAELLASWDYIEKVRGQPDWNWLDALFEAAHIHGMRILLGTGSPNPPIWMLDAYPDIQILDREDRPFPTGTVWGWACRNHPGYRLEVERYVRLLIERYGDHPALWAWQIDNEPGYPFVARRGEAAPRIHDYNKHTATAFRSWLQEKYQTLDVLNVAWRWDCTHHQYADWEQVQPPRSMPQEWGVVTAWLDWRTFLNENMAGFVRWQHEIIRSIDTRHPTVTNIFAFSGREIEMALDPWLMGRQADAIGYDLYPGIGGRLHRDPAYISLFLDIGRSTALHAGTEFWLPELESGPISGWALGPDYTTTPNDILRYNLEALGHGAKAILYQGYREWPCIPIHWGALADFEGQPTPRFYAAQQINAMLREHSALFQACQPPRAEVALFYDTTNTTLLHGMDAMELHDRCIRGAYTALWHAGYGLEFVDSTALEDWSIGGFERGQGDRETGRQGVGEKGWRSERDNPQVSSDQPPATNLSALSPLQPTTDNRQRTTDNYKVILLPCAMLIGQNTATALRAFVERAGTVIGFAKCAWVDGRGWSWPRQPGAGLDELFGVRAGEIVREDAAQITMEDGATVNGYWHRQPLRAQAGAEVLAHFADGSPAILRNIVGQGTAVLVGTHLDAAALEDTGAAHLLVSLVRQAGLRPSLQFEALPATVDCHVLQAEGTRLVIITNNGDEHAEVRLFGMEAASARDLLQNRPCDVSADGTVTVRIEAWGGVVVAVEGEMRRWGDEEMGR